MTQPLQFTFIQQGITELTIISDRWWKFRQFYIYIADESFSKNLIKFFLLALLLIYEKTASTFLRFTHLRETFFLDFSEYGSIDIRACYIASKYFILIPFTQKSCRSCTCKPNSPFSFSLIQHSSCVGICLTKAKIYKETCKNSICIVLDNQSNCYFHLLNCYNYIILNKTGKKKIKKQKCIMKYIKYTLTVTQLQQ